MARVNLGKVVPEKGVDYYTEAEKTELKQEIENDLSTQINKNKTDIQTLQDESGNSIEMSLDQSTYKLTLKLKNKAGQQISSQTIDLPNENSITDISYNNGKLTLTKQSGATTEEDITGLINGLATETALNNLANALKETIGIQTNTYDNTKTYNTGDIVVQNEKIYKANQDEITGTFDSSKWDELSLYEYQKMQDEAIEENYKVITKLQEENEDLKKNQLTNTPEIATSHYLQDSADSRFRKFIPIGRSVQDGDPTPENPVPIKNTGDNGSVNEKVQNKNIALVNSKTITGTTNATGQVGSIEGTVIVKDIPIENNTKYYISGQFPSQLTDAFKIFLYNGKLSATTHNGAYTELVTGNRGIQSGNNITEITNSANYEYMAITTGSCASYSASTSVTINIDKLMASTSSDTSYVPHSEQNISFPLAQGQKLMEGDYPDDDEKVHHKRMQIVLDGSDDEVFDKRTDTNEIRYYLPKNMKSNGKIIANYFMQRQSSSDKNHVRAVGTEPVNTIMFKSELLNTDEMTIPEWRQYLSEHNLILEIDLAEEQTEDFTEEQKTAWKEWKKARTYKNVTHISSEDETPANVEIEYVQDTKTYIDNKVTALTNAITSLGGNV